MNNPITAVLEPVIYSEVSAQFVKTYEAKKLSDKSGADWDDKTNPLLVELKREIKKHYLKAQDYTCAYCQQKIVVDHNGAWDTEHIAPRDSYPSFMFVPENLCVSCKDCNGAKSNKTVLANRNRRSFPRHSKDYTICHPHFDTYSKHIRVIGEAVLYLPRTKKGQALIEMCGLLRFVYGFADYEIADLNFGSKVIALGTELQNAQSAFEQIAIAQILRTMLDEGLRGAALKQLKQLEL
ncbi:HNH endonuclease [Pseudomonas viridiflava]|uniref:HNH endonuclease n=1 Tax=Pseudomonas viridiflava TaxID=33069 RepID=UPI002EC8248D|nr:HNH endonuclease [Pseudomonas viridiflava]